MSNEPLHCSKCDDVISTHQIAVVNARQLRMGKPISNPKVCATCILNAIMTARPEEDDMDTARDAIVEAAKARRIARKGQQFWKDMESIEAEEDLAVDTLMALEELAQARTKEPG